MSSEPAIDRLTPIVYGSDGNAKLDLTLLSDYTLNSVQNIFI